MLLLYHINVDMSGFEVNLYSCDEYQDTNKAQYELIRLLCQEHKNLFVVGDDAQSIYGFRCADISNILNFQKEFEGKVYKLEQNYRSTSVILNAANAVIKNNKEQLDKKLWTENISGDKIIYHVAENEYEEAAMVQAIIRNMIELKGDKPGDFAILYRTNMLSRVMEEALISNRVPCQLVGGTSFYERKEIKDMFAYLKVINNPSDSISLARVINTPKRGVGDTTIKKIQAYAIEKDLTLLDAIGDIDNIPGRINKKTVNAVKEFHRVILDLHTFSREQGRTSEQIIRAILESTGYVKALEESGNDDDLQRADHVDELVRIAAQYDNSTNEEDKLSYFLMNMSLLSDVDSMDESDSVKLMTVHASKGLEFPYVFIIGMEEGIFPHGMALAEGPKQVEEERRLFYVAITRAEKRLYLSMTVKRNPYFMDPDFLPKNKPSRFLKEIPKELITTI